MEEHGRDLRPTVDGKWLLNDDDDDISVTPTDLSNALLYYEKSLQIDLSYSLSNYQKFSPTYPNIGEIFRQEGDLDLAINYYEKSFESQLSSSKSYSINTASLHNNLAVGFNREGKCQEAIESHQRTLELEVVHLLTHHLNLA
ncbi:unnamed protein product [Rotaria sp. Silwood1]|nr:unnamed protein product [Rotaria sp. Silwood1]